MTGRVPSIGSVFFGRCGNRCRDATCDKTLSCGWQDFDTTCNKQPGAVKRLSRYGRSTKVPRLAGMRYCESEQLPSRPDPLLYIYSSSSSLNLTHQHDGPRRITRQNVPPNASRPQQQHLPPVVGGRVRRCHSGRLGIRPTVAMRLHDASAGFQSFAML